MKYIEFTGKTVEEAVEKGLNELGLTKETADIRVLEEGKKKLFKSVEARVEIAAKDCENTCDCACNCEEKAVSGDKTDGERAVEFLEGLFNLLNVTACTELVTEGEQVEINVTAANTNSIIGKRGVMLDAIQTLAGAVANIGREEYLRVVVDCENYRENREETLKKLADNLAQKATRLGKKVKLEPMNPYERRIIHAALSNRTDVTTESEGKEPNRYIVVIPENLADPDAPAIEARGERRERNGGKGGFNRNNSRGGKKPFNKGGRNNFKRSNASSGSGNSGGTSMKSSNDFFGYFLGNSGNSGEDK